MPSLNRSQSQRFGHTLALAGLALIGLSGCGTLNSTTRAADAGANPASAAVVVDRASPSEAARAQFAQAIEAMERVRFDEARAAFEALAAAYPHMSGPHTNLGILAAQVDNDPAQALEHFGAAVSANPDNAVAHNWMGVLLREQGAYAKAEQHYLSALRARPDYPLAHRNLGMLYELYLERPEQATRHYDAYRQLAEGSDALMAEVWMRALRSDQFKQPAVAAMDAGGTP